MIFIISYVKIYVMHKSGLF